MIVLAPGALGELVETKVVHDGLGVEGHRVERLAVHLADRPDVVVKPVDGDASVLVDHRGEDPDEFPGRVRGRPAEVARVQVAVRPGRVDLDVEQAARTHQDVRAARGVDRPVRDVREVGREFVGVLLDDA